jgi:hypothetical protein
MLIRFRVSANGSELLKRDVQVCLTSIGHDDLVSIILTPNFYYYSKKPNPHCDILHMDERACVLIATVAVARGSQPRMLILQSQEPTNFARIITGEEPWFLLEYFRHRICRLKEEKIPERGS